MGNSFGYCDNENRKANTKHEQTFYEKMANENKQRDNSDVYNYLGLKPNL